MLGRWGWRPEKNFIMDKMGCLLPYSTDLDPTPGLYLQPLPR